MVFITCFEYYEDVTMCFDICVFTVVCVGSLCSKDHILRSCILLGSIVYIYFCVNIYSVVRKSS